MKTINDKKVSLPKMKDCRIDYKTIAGTTYTVLVDFITSNILYCNTGVKGLKETYSDFKFIVLSELTIGPTYIFSYMSEGFTPLENVDYSLY